MDGRSGDMRDIFHEGLQVMGELAKMGHMRGCSA